ncbi:hypothetical protein CHU98_g10859 [Xylaria longipes]|nr:hypothetical protein CHU98_g10859 [Xylaria longipes]
MQASRDGGRNALYILKNLEDGDGNIIVLKGIICLQAYYDRINMLPVEEAESIIAADDAGRIVHDWVSQPHVWKEIESNHEYNKTLIQLVTYIIVGARQTTMIETWMGEPKNIEISLASDLKAFQKQFKWKSIMMRSSTAALISWHPEGLADSGYDFFSRNFDKTWINSNGTDDYKLSRYLWSDVTTMLSDDYMSKKQAASSRSFERCANHIIAGTRLYCPPGQALETGLMALNHPNRPSAHQFLAACREVCHDRDHPLRSFWPRGSSKSASKHEYARFIYALGHQASRTFNRQGHFDEGALILKIVYEIWGWDSDFLKSGHLYLERLEKWKQRNQEIMKTLHPKFYAPFVF